MAQDVELTPGTRKALLWGVVLVLIPVLAVFGWVILRLTAPAEPCPLCEAVATGDPAAVGRALDAGGAVTTAAWHDALERVASPQDHEGPPLAIVSLLVDHGADPNEFWRPTFSYTRDSGSTVGLTLGSTTVSSGGSPSRASSQRIYAAAVLAGDTDDVATMNRFLAKGLDVKGQGAGEALVAAAFAGHLKTVQRLVEAGVNVNYVASEAPRRTALAEAIQTRHLALIRVLEEAGAREW